MLDIITIFGLILVGCIALVVWTEPKSKLALDKDALDEEWREAPNDPHYAERRHYEERKRVVSSAGFAVTLISNPGQDRRCHRYEQSDRIRSN